MIFKTSNIYIADNTGPKKAKCLNIKKKKNRIFSRYFNSSNKKKI